MISCVLAAGLFFSAAAAQAASSSDIRAAAEVSASSGPIRLIFRIHKTRIRVGESVWHQIGVQNVGASEITIGDQVFFDGSKISNRMRDEGVEYGIGIEVQAPDGSLLDPVPYSELYPFDSEEEEPGVSGLLEIDTPELEAQVKTWKGLGLSQTEINRRLIEYHEEKAIRSRPRPEAIFLEPRQTVFTKSWFFYSERDRRLRRPRPTAIGDFAELDDFELSRPGVYKVRAVYARRPERETLRQMKKEGLEIKPWHVTVRTPWIRVRVLP